MGLYPALTFGSTLAPLRRFQDLVMGVAVSDAIPVGNLTRMQI